MKQIKVVQSFEEDLLKCPRCQSDNCRSHGKNRGKQTYVCKDCRRRFYNPNQLRLKPSKYQMADNIPIPEMKLLDVWSLKRLGKLPSSGGGNYSLNFSDIHPTWLKQAIKEFIWSKISTSSTISLVVYVGKLKIISKFIEENDICLQPKEVNRVFINNLRNHLMSLNLAPSTISHYICTWKYFFDFCQENNIIPESNGKLIFDEDYPKHKYSQVKNIPDYVIEQLKSKIVLLAQPIALIVELLLETGMRIDEVCNLNYNCLNQDSDGDWWLYFYRSKVNKENKLFISKKLAIQIQEQQKYIQEYLSINFKYLFCSTQYSSSFEKYGTKEIERGGYRKLELNYFAPIPKQIRQHLIRGYLKKLAYEHNITDISSQIYPIWKCHRFRHTHLTDLARKGTGIAHIMQRAGHASPQMAMQYIHLTDEDQKKKMKEVWDNTHFNIEGEIVAPINPDLDTAEMQWIKKGMGVQTTDNGYYTLLWTQTCPYQQLPCKECGSWVTTLNFLDSHKKELEETEKVIENARQKGYQRQIEKNVPRAERLRKIISGMEKHKTIRGIGHNEWEKEDDQ